MKLWQYIQGNRRGKEAHLIEKEAMKDPFLADALEGYENVSGNHQREANKLQKNIIKRQKQIAANAAGKKPFNLKGWAIAASVLLVVGAGAWFMLNDFQFSKESHTPPPSTPRADLAKAPEPVIATSQTEDADSILPISPQQPMAMAAAPTTSVVPTEAPVVVKEESKKEEKKQIEEEKTVIATPEATVTPPAAVAAEAPVAATRNTESISTASPNSEPEAGLEAYHSYIKRNLVRPTDDECRNVKGTVIVEFKVGQSGRPYNIRVSQGLCTSINKEAIRLIINGPKWKKGTTSDDAKISIDF